MLGNIKTLKDTNSFCLWIMHSTVIINIILEFPVNALEKC